MRGIVELSLQLLSSFNFAGYGTFLIQHTGGYRVNDVQVKTMVKYQLMLVIIT